MTEYSVRDALLGIREEEDGIREQWQDQIADRYLQVLTRYEEQLQALDRALIEGSEDLERIKVFCREIEACEARYGIGTYRKTLY